MIVVLKKRKVFNTFMFLYSLQSTLYNDILHTFSDMTEMSFIHFLHDGGVVLAHTFPTFDRDVVHTFFTWRRGRTSTYISNMTEMSFIHFSHDGGVVLAHTFPTWQRCRSYISHMPVRTSGGKCTLDCDVCILLNQLQFYSFYADHTS